MKQLPQVGCVLRCSIFTALISLQPVWVRATDAGYYLLYKQEFYTQTGAGLPSPNPSTPYKAGSRISLTSTGSITSATMGIPAPVNRTFPYSFNAGDDAFDIQVQAATQSGINGTAPAGQYTLTVNTLHDGAKVLKPTVPTVSSYPVGPHISNWFAAQTINPASSFTLTWDSLPGGTTNDYVRLTISGNTGAIIFRSPDPLQTGALNGTSNAFTIPANTLGVGRSFSAELNFAIVDSTDTTSYPGALGLVAEGSCTDFPIATGATLGPDVKYYLVAKGTEFNQTASGLPVPKGSPVRFFSSVGLSSPTSATTATVQFLPGGPTNALTLGVGGIAGVQDTFSLQAKFTNQTALDAAYPDGNYQMSIQAVHDGTKSLTLDLTGDAYPTSAPFITNPFDTNYNVVFITDPAAPFTLTWAPFTGGTVNDFIQVTLSDTLGNPILQTPDPGQPGALNGTASSLVIQSNTLPPGSLVAGELVFARVVQSNLTAYAGVPGYAAYYAGTSFGLVTLAEDVLGYNLTKLQILNQTNSGAPTPAPGLPFRAVVQVFATASNTVTAAQVQLPAPGGLETLTPDPTDTVFGFQQKFGTLAGLDAAFPAGSYTFQVSAVHDGNRGLTLSIPSDAFPNSPQAANWAAAQNVDPATDFTLSWDAFSGSTSQDDIMVLAADSLGNLVGGNSLTNTATSFDFPPGTFQSNQNYQVEIQFRHFTTIDITDYPGATGSVRFVSRTFFNLTTAGSSIAPSLAVVTSNSSNLFQLALTGQAGLLYAIDASTNLQPGFWVPLVTNTATGGQFIFTDSQSSNFPVRFYRARQL